MNFTLDPKKKGFKKRKGSKKERVQKNKDFKRNPLKREFHKELNISKRTHNSNTRYRVCGIGVECLAKNSNWC
ncbi:hypothetical protein DD741_00435 [Helicobacter pylori]|nr:hypothetical protein DD741_00435 [Helicobacter pylori]